MEISNKQALTQVVKEKQPALVRPRNIFRLIFTLIILNMTTMNCGYNIAYITALGANNLTLVYGSSIANPVVRAFCIACIPFGVSFGALLAIKVIPLTTRRRLILILATIELILSGIIQIEVLAVFFVCRVFQGTITGIYLILVPIYSRQVSPKEINKRGVFGVMPMLFVAFGIMAAFVLNTFFIQLIHVQQHLRWRLEVSVNMIVIALIMITVFLNIIPESPNSSISLGDQENAKKSIGIFHAERFIDQLYKQKVQQVQDAKKTPAPAQNIDKKIRYQKIFLTFGVPIMQQLTGVNAYISQMGFVTSAFDIGFGNYVPAIMGTVQWATALISMLYLYRIQRRKMILIGNLGTSICCFAMGITFFFINSFRNGFWIVVASIILFMAFNGIFLIPSVGLYIPTVGTKVQLQYSQFTNWFSCGVAVVLFPIINAYYGFSVMFLAFGTITLIFFFINYALMIDTKPVLKKIVNDQIRQLQLISNPIREQNDSWRNL